MGENDDDDVEQCFSCRHFDELADEKGKCRLRAPLAVAPDHEDTDLPLAAWPIVERLDWCGEWKGWGKQ